MHYILEISMSPTTTSTTPIIRAAITNPLREDFKFNAPKIIASIPQSTGNNKSPTRERTNSAIANPFFETPVHFLS